MCTGHNLLIRKAIVKTVLARIPSMTRATIKPPALETPIVHT